ncbi:MAG: GCN5-related N-acetyltransferase [Arthrobacter sp.]|nr:GCN5-related N-acetyltransferase [Arthrobacter sp.]
MTTAPYRIESLALPAFLDSPDAGAFLAVGELCDVLTLETWGNLDRAAPPEARLQDWRDNAYRTVRVFFVRDGARVVGSSWIRCEVQENLRSALLHVQVLKEFTGRGIGRALLQHTQELAAAEGRTILQTFTEHPADFDSDGPGVLRPATGTGALPAGSRGVRFALKAGFRLEQVERFSVLDVPARAGTWDVLEREARARAGEDYELVAWTGKCPEDSVDGLAVLMSRMSTDVPTGELRYDEESWDVARVRHVEDMWQQAGIVSLVAAARHLPSGKLAAYSVLQLTPSKPWLADQDDTLVAKPHRGHRLGMLVKLVNLRRLRSEYPDVERVITFNAAENDHMLAINVALGFRPAGWDGEWQRIVAT